MDSILKFARLHPFLAGLHTIYLMMWVFFVRLTFAPLPRISPDGGVCSTGLVACFFMGLILSAAYFCATVLMILFNVNKRLYAGLLVAIFIPPVVGYLFMFFAR